MKLVMINQLGVVHPEQVHDRRVQVVHVQLVFHRVKPEFVGLAVAGAGLHARADLDAGRDDGEAEGGTVCAVRQTACTAIQCNTALAVRAAH